MIRAMFWDDLVRKWRHQMSLSGSRMRTGAAGYVEVIPPRRRDRRVTPLILAVLGLILILLAVSQVRVDSVTPSYEAPTVATSSG